MAQFSLTIYNADGTEPQAAPFDLDGFDAHDQPEIIALKLGETASFGGGAQPIFEVRRVA